MKRTLAIVGTISLILVAIELGAAATLAWRDMRNRVTPTERSGPYWSEWRTAVQHPGTMRYHGDGIWRTAPFSGHAIHVDANGLRRTVGIECRAGSPVIAIFGPSAVWGHGVTDEETIPSRLAERFRLEGTPACVRNYGDWGMTTTSGLRVLQRELQDGRAPTIAVFFTGAHDVKGAYFGHVRPFGSESDTWTADAIKAARYSAWQRTNTAGLLRRLTTRDLLRTELPTEKVEESALKAMRVVTTTETSIRGIAAAHHFTPVFALQTYVAVDPKPLTRDEHRAIEALEQESSGYASAVRRFYSLARARRQPDFVDLSSAFAGHTTRLYLDAGHLTPEGTEILANRLYEKLRLKMPRTN